MLDDFIKNYDADYYKRHPKAKVGVRVVYVFLAVVLIVVILRAVLWIMQTQK